MILTYRQMLRPTRVQQRLLYNAALQERRDDYRLQRKAITRAEDPEGHGAIRPRWVGGL
ncbi:hypothetical protein [Methylobacterium sp.]|uniref:hypothetical protein n=1 Tax=Methylobacterium sp. TaxID=409 RepID=UPI00257981ED|nr:hypothetical protein [Methylobacterium sp.]